MTLAGFSFEGEAMTPQEYAQQLRKRGYSYEQIRLLVGLTYGKPVSYRTILNWLSEKRRNSQRKYMRGWMRKHRAAEKQPGKPVVDRNRFDIEGPFA